MTRLAQGSQLWNAGHHADARLLFESAGELVAGAREDTRAGADGGIGETLRGATFAWLGRAYLHDSQPWLARTAFRLAVHAQPLCAEFRCLFGETLEALSAQGLRYREEARETLLVAAELDPTLRRAWHGANRSMAAPDNVPEELRAAGAALTMSPPQADTAEAHALRGLERAAQGDAPAALAAYIAAADRRPTDPMILWRFGCALAASGDGPAAVAPLAVAARLDPTRPRYAAAEAYLLAALGRHADALPAYERLLAIAPNHLEHWLALATSATAAGAAESVRHATATVSARYPGFFDTHPDAYRAWAAAGGALPGGPSHLTLQR